MTTARHIYRQTRPQLTIELTGGRSLGRCYSETTYRVTSTRKIPRDRLLVLNGEGFLGFGQEFGINSPCDGEEKPAGHDTLPCVNEDTGEPGVNPYSGMSYPDIQSPYYVYECYSRCDSGD